jgi:predicted CXXCH cytochrome family protein
MSAAAGFLFCACDKGATNAVSQRPQLVAGSDAGYVDPATCQPCHAEISQTYRQTGMGRSFYGIRPEKAGEDWQVRNTYYHRASDRYYTMYEREGKHYQRRHQIGFDGRETNVVEKEIHFVIGSGNHARTYLHRTADGKMFELPVAWYSEKGGFWAMNPGYDRPDHHDSRRRIAHECMFCHNGYPEIEPGSDIFGRESRYTGNIPEGIDCQRCHGPGRDHIRAVGARAGPEAIRGAVVNPVRLDRQRQIELCMQCHLETTSARLPPYFRRFNRGFFSFRPSERLSDYMLHFDHAPGTGYDDKFELVSAAYRLRRSACFQKSALTCTTCHNPHDIPRGKDAARHYNAVCQGCHGESLQQSVASKRHTGSPECINCHMPKRRTDDVVHVVMTDHYIQRQTPRRDLLAPLHEERFYGRKYRAEVVPYYPADLGSTAEGELYLAVAQLTDGTNLTAGIARLERAIAQYRPKEAGFYFELASAYATDRRFEEAISWYEETLRRKPDLWIARHRLGTALLRSGELARAAEELKKAAGMGTEVATTLSDLALVYRQQGKLEEAAVTLREALSLDPNSPEIPNNLGGVLFEVGDRPGAEAAFRSAIRIQPDFAAAHNNLAKLLAAREDFREAEYHFQNAIRNLPSFAQARYDYGLTLAQMQMYERAQAEIEAAVRLQPEWVEAHNTLGQVMAMRGRIEEALRSYRRALQIDPAHHQTHFNLATLLAVKKDLRQALIHFQRAAESPDQDLRQEALAAIAKITGRAQ